MVSDVLGFLLLSLCNDDWNLRNGPWAPPLPGDNLKGTQGSPVRAVLRANREKIASSLLLGADFSLIPPFPLIFFELLGFVGS